MPGPSVPKMPKPSPRYLGKMRKSSSKGDVPQTESPAATPKGEDKRKCSTPQGESEAASTIQKRFRRRSTGQKAEPGASSPGGAAAPKRKSMIPGFMRKKSTSEEEEAAVKIQARFRGLKVRQTGGSTKHINTSIIPKQLRQAGEAIDESFINFKTGVAQKAAAKGAALGIKTALATDPWIPKSVAKAIETPTIALIDEVLRRASHAELETAGPRAPLLALVRLRTPALPFFGVEALVDSHAVRSHKLREILSSQLKIENWPKPPPKSSGLVWARAKFLYALNCADKSVSYRVFQEQWMLVLYLSLYLPPIFPFFGISVIAWIIYWLAILRVQDEFQLFNFIARFKTYCFVMVGILPIFGDFFLFYFVLSSGTIEEEEPGFFWWYNLLCNRAFIALWVMCWIVYWRYLQLRKKHYGGAVAAAAKPDSSTSTKGKAAATTPADMEAGHLPAAAPLPAAQKSGLAAGLLANATHQLQGEALAIACAEAAIHTGDSDTGDLEQTALMAWDAIVIAVHAIFGFLDLYLRIGGSVAQAVFSPNYKTMLFERFLVTSISIFSAPFILWKLPIAGELFHQMRPTGFDQAGKLRLQMSLGEMKKLYGETRASRIAKGLDKTAGKLDKAFGLGSKKTNADASKAKPPATHAHTVARSASAPKSMV